MGHTMFTYTGCYGSGIIHIGCSGVKSTGISDIFAAGSLDMHWNAGCLLQGTYIDLHTCMLDVFTAGYIYRPTHLYVGCLYCRVHI